MLCQDLSSTAYILINIALCQLCQGILYTVHILIHTACSFGMPHFTVQQGQEHTSEAPKLEAKVTPIEELLAAEQQSATQAAAKKAKKQKQKAKKQQQKQDQQEHQQQQEQEQQAHEAQQPLVLHKQQLDSTAQSLVSNAAEIGDVAQPLDVTRLADASFVVASSLRSIHLNKVADTSMPGADEPLQQQSAQSMPGSSADLLQNFFCCPLTKVQLPSLQFTIKCVVCEGHSICEKHGVCMNSMVSINSMVSMKASMHWWCCCCQLPIAPYNFAYSQQTAVRKCKAQMMLGVWHAGDDQGSCDSS